MGFPQTLWVLAALAGLLPVPDIAASQQIHDSVPPRATVPADAVVAAAALLREGRWEAAFDILGPRAGDDPRAVALLFDAGMATLGPAHRPGMPEAERAALLEVSITAFRAILAAGPGQNRVRLELARALFLQERYGAARRQFERILAGDVPEPVAANVRRFIAEIDRRRRWRTYGGFALAPDTNIGGATSQRTITIGGLPFTLDRQPTSGVGLSVWGGWEYRHPVSERVRLRFGGDISRTEYKGSEFDRMTLSVRAGPRWLIPPRTEASLLAQARRQWDRSSPSYDELGLRFEGVQVTGSRVQLRFDGSLAERSWRTEPARDGPVRSLSFGGRYLASPNLSLDASAFWRRDRPEGRPDLRNGTYGLSLRASRDLPRGFTLAPSVTVSRTRYDEIGFATTDSDRRSDRTVDLSIGLTRRDLTFGRFSPSLRIGQARRYTNALTYDYRRTYGELSLVRQF